MNATAQWALEAAVCLSLQVGATAALILAPSRRAIRHVPAAVLASVVIAVGLLRYYVPPQVWPRLGWIRRNADGSELYLESHWFFLFPVVVGLAALVTWVFCQGVLRHWPNKSRQPTAAPPRSSTP